jgi:hypothetical protein
MNNTKALCKECANKEICKYTGESFDLAKSICETIKIGHPFSIDVKCKYFKNIISNPRTRTDGM